MSWVANDRPDPHGGRTVETSSTETSPATEGPRRFHRLGGRAGRSVEIAESLGGQALVLFPPVERRRPHPLVRYTISSFQTVSYLVRADPGAVVATNPPVVLGLIALAWARVRRIPFALDSHPGAFGKQGDRVAARLLLVHRYLVKRATVTLVTAASWVETVREWGGRGRVVHEAPGGWEELSRTMREPGNRPKVLLVSRFAGDEPMEQAVKTGALVP